MPVLAICYDFDRTLTPSEMQAQGYVQAVGYDAQKFWSEASEFADKYDMDENLACMYKMVKEAEGNLILNRAALAEYGSKVKLFKGVESWFKRLNEYGKSKNVAVEHYIISSGLKEMIEGTAIASEFTEIYASSFYFNERGVAEWPALTVNYTNKTQFLTRISKGVYDVNDRSINNYYKPEELRVPYRNIVYIGDSLTDIPCMKIVNSYGGHSVGVYDPTTKNKEKVHKMMRENRIRYFAPADYREGSELDLLLHAIIDKTAADEVLEKKYAHDKGETE